MNSTITMPAPASTDPREFFAMRARQKKAKRRMRKFKLAFLCLSLAGLAIAVPRWRQRLSVRKAEAQALVVAPAPAAARVEAPAPATIAPPVEAPLAAEPAPAAVETAAPAAEASACDEAFSRGQWRAAIASCTATFEADPAHGVAMKVAHAQWSHGQPAAAGQWAERALSLGTDNADAYVLVGHAARRARNAEKAIEAYRSYLRLAPYGWHAQRVRAAIRAMKANVSTGQDG
jgi:hypothetical protein